MIQNDQEKEALSAASSCFNQNFFFQENRDKLNLLNARFSITSPAYDNFGLGCSCNTSREYTWVSLLPAEPGYLKETNLRNCCNAAEQTSRHTCTHTHTKNKLTIAVLQKKLVCTHEWTHTHTGIHKKHLCSIISCTVWHKTKRRRSELRLTATCILSHTCKRQI